MRQFHGRSRQGGWAWLAAAAPALISGAASYLGGRQRNRAQVAMSDRQMAFQRSMSNTAHQREVADLRKAGLNPILSGTGGQGASSPGGAQAQIQDIATPAVSSALAARRMAQEILNLKASEEVSITQADNNSARTALVNAQTGLIAAPAGIGAELGEAVEYGRRFIPNVIEWLKRQGSSARQNFLKVIQYDREGNERARRKADADRIRRNSAPVGTSGDRRRQER